MDNVLRSLGWSGLYQKIQFILLMIPVIDLTFHVMSYIFLGRYFDHKCAKMDISYSALNVKETILKNSTYDVNTTLSVTYGKCGVTVTNQSDEIFSSKCVEGYEYSKPRESSFVAEWDLVCEKGALPELSQTFMNIGMMIGSSFMMTLADKYGRKPIYVICHVLYFATSVAIAFCPTFTTLVGLRLAHGTFQQGTGLTSAIMLAELMPTEKRAFPSQVGCLVWPSGLLCLGLVCYLCQDMNWRTTQLVLASISCYSLLQWWFVEESFRWLDVNGKTKRVEKLIKKAAKLNRVNFETVLRTYKEDSQTLLAVGAELANFPPNGINDDGQSTTKGHGPKNGCQLDSLHSNSAFRTEDTTQPHELSFATFLKNKTIFLRAAVSCYAWFADGMVYYGLLVISPSLTDNFYLGFFLNVLVEFPAGIALITLINRVGRRQCTIVSHFIGGASLGIAVLLSNVPAAAGIPGLENIILTVSLLGKFGISLGFGTLFLYTPELFPTTIRSTGLGISSFVARLGGMVAPYSRPLLRHLPWLPGTIFAALALFVPVLVRLLPETYGRELPQTVSDVGTTNRTRSMPASKQRSPIVIGLSIKKKEDASIEVRS